MTTITMTTRLHHVENADETDQDWWYSGTAGMMVQHVIWRSGSAHVQIKANQEKAGDAQWLSSLPSLPFTDDEFSLHRGCVGGLLVGGL